MTAGGADGDSIAAKGFGGGCMIEYVGLLSLDRLERAVEKMQPEDTTAAPDVSESVSFRSFRVLTLEAVVRMKLTSYRDTDKTHVRDMIAVGLVDATWPACYPPALADRLQHLLDTPDG